MTNMLSKPYSPYVLAVFFLVVILTALVLGPIAQGIVLIVLGSLLGVATYKVDNRLSGYFWAALIIVVGIIRLGIF